MNVKSLPTAKTSKEKSKKSLDSYKKIILQYLN